MRRVIASVLVAVVVVLAGCGGITGSESETTGSPTSTETARSTTTETPVDASGFPAVDGKEVNETDLYHRHDRALSNTSSYTLSLNQRVGNTVVNVDVKRNDDESLLRNSFPSGVETDYTNGSTEYIRTKYKNGTVEYRNQTTPDDFPYTGFDVIDDFVDSANHTPSNITTHNSTEVLELTATQEDIKSGALQPNTTVTEFESRILVDRKGRIHLFVYRIAGIGNDGERFAFRLRFELSDIGSTTVSRPSWVSQA